MITIRFWDYNVMKTLILFTFLKISRYTLIHSIAGGALNGNHGMECGDLDIWLIKIMFVWEHVGVLKQSSFMHSLLAQDFNLVWISGVFISADFPCK